MKILLDLDGVIVDFVEGACQAHHRRMYDEPLKEEEAGGYHIEKLWGISRNAFWKPMAEPEFWRKLDWMPDGREILEIVERAVGPENVCLLTSPSVGSGPVVGKLDWIEKNMPAYEWRYLIGPVKDFCAGPDAILVDDSDGNVGSFAEAGGGTVLVPRPWNSNWEHRHDAVEWVKWSLETLTNWMEVRI